MSTDTCFTVTISSHEGQILVLTKYETTASLKAACAALHKVYKAEGYRRSSVLEYHINSRIVMRCWVRGLTKEYWHIFYRLEQDFDVILKHQDIRSRFEWADSVTVVSRNGTEGRLFHSILDMCTDHVSFDVTFENMKPVSPKSTYSTKLSLLKAKHLSINYDDETVRNMAGKFQFLGRFTDCWPEELWLSHVHISPTSLWPRLVSSVLVSFKVPKCTEADFRAAMEVLERKHVRLQQVILDSVGLPEGYASPVFEEVCSLTLANMTEAQIATTLKYFGSRITYLVIRNPTMQASGDRMGFIASLCSQLEVLAFAGWETFVNRHINCLSKAFELNQRERLEKLLVDEKCGLDRKYLNRAFLWRHESSFTKRISLCSSIPDDPKMVKCRCSVLARTPLTMLGTYSCFFGLRNVLCSWYGR